MAEIISSARDNPVQFITVGSDNDLKAVSPVDVTSAEEGNVQVATSISHGDIHGSELLATTYIASPRFSERVTPEKEVVTPPPSGLVYNPYFVEMYERYRDYVLLRSILVSYGTVTLDKFFLRLLRLHDYLCRKAGCGDLLLCNLKTIRYRYALAPKDAYFVESCCHCRDFKPGVLKYWVNSVEGLLNYTYRFSQCDLRLLGNDFGCRCFVCTTVYDLLRHCVPMSCIPPYSV
jgi:hypothetical protein